MGKMYLLHKSAKFRSELLGNVLSSYASERDCRSLACMG